MTHRLKLITVLTIILLLTACRFQLRGNASLPDGIEPLYITNNDSFSIGLNNQLTSSGIKTTSDPNTAMYKIIITNRESNRRTAALGEKARVLEYFLLEKVEFEVRDASNNIAMEKQQVTVRKIMQNDPNKVVSTAEEEKILRREMQENIAARIVRQLRSLKPPSISTMNSSNNSN